MCHAMNTKRQACRRKGGSYGITLTTIEPTPQTFYTGLCGLHLNQVLNTDRVHLFTAGDRPGLWGVDARKATIAECQNRKAY